MKLVRNTAEGVKFIIDTKVCTVLAVICIRMSPTNKKDMERLRQLQLRREEGM
jgi:SET domain-containing protein